VSDVFVQSTSLMGTVLTVEVIGHGENDQRRAERANAAARAIGWFQHVEDCCSRFDPCSELRRISERIGVPIAVSVTTLEIVRFALALADETGGAFDPTVGYAMVERGFDRHYRTGEAVEGIRAAPASYRDVEIDAANATITLHRPLQLDLGAVAKGFAIDLAARELSPLVDFAINAGGDLFLSGHNAAEADWSVGIRHPRDEHTLLDTICVSNVAVCTSGDYERRSSHEGVSHHILDPRSGASADAVASVTVIAPLAIVADGLATAAFVLGPTHGLELLARHGVEGLIVAPNLERFETPGWPRG
jgi:thiamine biosynthesis lipoprotein